MHSGRAFLLQVDISGTMTTVAQCTSNSINFSRSNVDTSNKGSSGYRDLGVGYGSKSCEIQASGVYSETDTAFNKLWSAFNGGTTLTAQMLFSPGTDEIQGDFEVSSLQITGENDGAVQFSATLTSTGAFTATGFGN